MKPSDLSGMMRAVFQACEKNPACKSDDRLLIWTIWQGEYPALHRQPLSLSVFRQLTCPETIRRARQKLQEAGFCRPLEYITEHRQQTAQEFKADLDRIRKKTLLF